MAGPVNLLNANFGVADILPPLEDGHLPEAADLSTAKLNVSNLEQLFADNNVNSLILKALDFEVKDKELLNGAKFNAALRDIQEELSLSRDPAVREFVRNDLAPLLENQDLLNAYLGMMVEV